MEGDTSKFLIARWFVSRCIVACLVLVVIADSALSGLSTGPASEVTTEQIREWVGQLDSDQFLQRKAATGKLIAAGLPAVAPLVESLSNAQKELIARGIYILEELAKSRHKDTATSAREAIEQLIPSSDAMVVRRAEKSLRKLNEIRQARAMSALKSLGAEIHMQTVLVDGRMVAKPYFLRIDDSWRGIDEDLIHLEALSGVKIVSLEGRQVSGQWLSRLARLKTVEVVSLVHVDFANTALGHLAKITNLRKLIVLYSPFTDGAVEHLLRLTSVRSLVIYGSRLSLDGRQVLDDKIKWANLEIKNGAFLGISPIPTDDRVIGTVQSGSAAQRAGLVVNDRITHYDGQEIKNFESLKEMIGQNYSGDEVEIRVLRGAEEKRILVKLGEWDARRLSF